MTKRICTVDTVYSLFLYFLIKGVSDDDLFIFSSGVLKMLEKILIMFIFQLPDLNLMLMII